MRDLQNSKEADGEVPADGANGREGPTTDVVHDAGTVQPNGNHGLIASEAGSAVGEVGGGSGLVDAEDLSANDDSSQETSLANGMAVPSNGSVSSSSHASGTHSDPVGGVSSAATAASEASSGDVAADEEEEEDIVMEAVVLSDHETDEDDDVRRKEQEREEEGERAEKPPGIDFSREELNEVGCC